MKKTLCLLLAVVLITALFAGCTPAVPETSGTTAPTTVPTQPTDPAPTDPADPTDPAQPTDPTDPTDPTEPAEPVRLNFTYQCVETFIYSDELLQNPECHVIRSLAELEAYCLSHAARVEKTDFVDIIAGYNDEYFAENTLIIIVPESGGIPNYFEVCDLVIQPEGNCVLNLKWMTPELVSDVCGSWHILVDVDGLIPENVEIDLEIEECIIE